VWGRNPVVRHEHRVDERDSYWANMRSASGMKMQPRITIRKLNGVLDDVQVDVNNNRHFFNSLCPSEFRNVMWLLRNLPQEVKEELGIEERIE
jgi:hypothetical protein